MQIIDCEQGSEQWFKIRAGIPTASCFNQLITTKGLPSDSRKKYMYKLAGEYITGKAEEVYQNANMIRGTEMEKEARSLYEVVTGLSVQTVGFCLADGYGASPDGLIGKKGMVQIKCPTMAIHVGYLLDNKLPTDYFQQVQGELFVAERDWSDFVSYYPAIKPLIVRVNRDEKFISALKTELHKFIDELKQVIKQIGE